MDDCVLRIGRLENGFTVEILDPDIQTKNRDPKSKIAWEDPWKNYAFPTAEAVSAFVASKLASLKPENPDDEFALAFSNASQDD